MIGSWYGWRTNTILRQQLAVIEAQQPKIKYNEHEQDMAIIIKYELEITMALSGGHKAADNDQFKEYRAELVRLRAKWNIPNHVQQKYGGTIIKQK